MKLNIKKLKNSENFTRVKDTKQQEVLFSDKKHALQLSKYDNCKIYASNIDSDDYIVIIE